MIKDIKRITPKNVFSYISGNSLLITDKITGLPEYIKEQVKYRQTKCPDCILTGKCLSGCNCELPGKHYAYHACDAKRYPDLMGAKEWKLYKSKNNITL